MAARLEATTWDRGAPVRRIVGGPGRAGIRPFRCCLDRAETLGMGAEATAEVDDEVVASVTSVEWFLFGGSVRRNIRNPKSRYYTLLPKYGKTKSVRIIVGSLWILPGFLFLIPAVVLNVVSTSDAHSVTRTVSYIFLGLTLLCGAFTILRAMSGRSQSA
jgi:hypothetical protein